MLIIHGTCPVTVDETGLMWVDDLDPVVFGPLLNMGGTRYEAIATQFTD